MKLINLSDSGIKANLCKKDLKELIILPDYSPSKGRLPVGAVAVYEKHHVPSSEFLGPDIGCGMALFKFNQPIKDIEYITYKLVAELRVVETELGSLGGGNHFINFYEVVSADALELKPQDILALIHSGSRFQGKRIFESKLKGNEYSREYNGAVEFGKRNRMKLAELVKKCSDSDLTLLLDLLHNTLEIDSSRFIYRKGAMNIKPGNYGVIASAIGQDIIIVRGTDEIAEIENSMCHGTGRKISRNEAREMEFDSSEIRKKICIPNLIYDENINTDAPHCYRTLDEVLPRIERYVSIVGRLKPLSYAR